MLNSIESGVVDVLGHFWLGAKWAEGGCPVDTLQSQALLDF
jgi:hypothetical protein